MMKMISFLLAMLGSVLQAYQAVKWLTWLDSERGGLIRVLTGCTSLPPVEFQAIKNATYALIVCALLGQVISFLVLMEKGNKYINGGLLIVGGSVPLLFSLRALGGLPMIMGGLLTWLKKTAVSKH
ncbi:MAG: hypothetical protein PVH61_09625 [Candidatus Aminicenantes bacterium]